ncbi:MAG: branched-chain amino acid transporter permease [Lachnospiraceae bacterium]|uniref:branched-chain amino acid transporter permease n=1 Tax=Parablautia sp. Marseille-Q6255 TaxID=3039593 RepID=UPI0024BD06C5|nr:AzlD domain-containing protein [Parablautia sp. Marseille-Q6255]
MTGNTYALLLVGVAAGVTALLRFLPFLVFRKHTPKIVLYLGEVLPCAIMGMLVVYCLRNVSIFPAAHALPEALAVALVVFLHRWKHNTLLSIAAGTVCYMFFVQAVFK